MITYSGIPSKVRARADRAEPDPTALLRIVHCPY